MPKISLFSKLKSLRPLWVALSPKRRRQLLVLQLLSLITAFGEVANLGALMPFLKLLANPLEGLKSLGPVGDLLKGLPNQNLLLALALGFIIVVTITTLLRVFTIQVQLKLAALIGSDLGEQVFAAVLSRPYRWHLQHNSSTTLGYLTKDVDQVFNSVQGLLVVIVNLALVIILGLSLIALAPKVMLAVAILFLIFYLLVYRFTRGELASDGKRLISNYETSLQVAQEGLGGIRDVILDKTQSFFLDAYKSYNLEYRMAASAINAKAQVPRYIIEGFTVALIVAVSVTLAMSGQGIERQLPLLGTLALGAYRLLQPLQLCFNGITGLKANQASLNRLQPYLGNQSKKCQRERENTINFTNKSPSQPLLTLHDINFRYREEDDKVLCNINLSIKAGERVAFVGSTGSGKSTLTDLILGLLSPTDGTILVHGLNLHESENISTSWKKLVAHVPQQIYLSDASFAANIAFGVPSSSIDHQRVRRAASQAQIAEVIESSSEGYSTRVGERGVRLSGGQRQRIGIARALYKQAELLVLDEATSALDNQTELEVMEAIESLDRGLTIIIIAHRLSTVRNCDRIVVMDKGRISGIGTYKDLEKSHSGFQRLAVQPPYPASS